MMSAQKKSTPVEVKTAFSQKFPNATKVKWHKENATEYEAEFKLDGKSHSANFSNTGEFLELEGMYSFKELPQSIQEAFKSNHKNATIKAVEKIQLANGEVKYEVEYKKGIKTIEVLYDESGNEIKM